VNMLKGIVELRRVLGFVRGKQLEWDVEAPSRYKKLGHERWRSYTTLAQGSGEAWGG
jgi:hypothetical protein